MGMRLLSKGNLYTVNRRGKGRCQGDKATGLHFNHVVLFKDVRLKKISPLYPNTSSPLGSYMLVQIMLLFTKKFFGFFALELHF